MKDTVEVFFHSQQPYTHVKEEDIAQYNSGDWTSPTRSSTRKRPTTCTISTTSNTPWPTSPASMA